MKRVLVNYYRELDKVTGFKDGHSAFIWDEEKFPDIIFDAEALAEEERRLAWQRENLLANKARVSSNVPSNVSRIDLFGVEKGIAYYDVYLTSYTDWKENDTLQQKVAKEAIAQCREKALVEGAKSYQVIGHESDGSNAFSWGGTWGTGVIQYYEDGKISHQYGLLPDEIQMLVLK